MRRKHRKPQFRALTDRRHVHHGQRRSLPRIDRQHVVGFEIDVAWLEAKHKLSQNRSAEDRRLVAAALQASDCAEDRALAAYMTRHAG